MMYHLIANFLLRYAMMTNEYQEWLSDFTDEQRRNYDLCMKYPILIPTNRWTGKAWDNYAYESTELDLMPSGWRIAFGEQWAADVQKAINKSLEKERDQIRIIDIKEKYGYLHAYFTYYTKELEDVLIGYESLSRCTCILCGAPATNVSTGWILPYCDKCTESVRKNFVDI